MQYTFLNTNKQLAKFCQQASAQTMLMLDTEFIREKTYYPLLGLIQIYDGKNIGLIDPLRISDWQPFISLLLNENIIKFLHASGEDLEIFSYQFSTLPKPFFDTQILAAFLGHPPAFSFFALVEHYCNVTLDKSHSRSNWLARPLTKQQCQYAINDVRYLYPVAQQLYQSVCTQGWLSAAVEECHYLAMRRQTSMPPQVAYKKVGQAWQLTRQELAVLQQLAAWRLVTAQATDHPVKHVLSDEILWWLARRQPNSLQQLACLGLHQGLISNQGDTILGLIEKSKKLTITRLPQLLVMPILTSLQQEKLQALQKIIVKIAAQKNISATLLATRKQLIKVIRWYESASRSDVLPTLLTGWRKPLLADAIAASLAVVERETVHAVK